MTAARRHVVAVSAGLLFILAIGVVFLVRLAAGIPSNGDVVPITSPPDATLVTDDSGPTAADDTRTDSDYGNLGPRDDSNTRTINPEPQPPRPRPQGGENAPTADPGTQPPRPAVPLSSVGGMGPRVYVPAGPFMATWYVYDSFSVQVRLVDINFSQPGNELVLYAPAGEDVTKCYRHTIEPGETGRLCGVHVRASESAEAGHYTGSLELVFEATCTTTDGRPCQKLPERHAPSPNNPINVTWNEYLRVEVEAFDDPESPSSTAESPSFTTEPPSPTTESPSSTAEPTP